MIYRIVPAALVVALCAAFVSAARGADGRQPCVGQTVTRMQTQAPSIS